MTQHTPTPWVLQEVISDADQSYRVVSNAENEIDNFGSGWGDISGASGLIFHDAHYYPMAPNKEDAAFIVRAANTFDDFIIACHDALDEIENGGHREKTIQALKNILARAEEKALP